MKNLTGAKKAVVILAGIMTALSFTNLLGLRMNGEPLKLAGLSVFVGLAAYFATRGTNGTKTEGLDTKKFIGQLRDKKVLLLFALLLVMTVVSYGAGKLWMPEYVEHLRARTDFLAVADLPKLLLELAVFALGEEIAWRAFFQKQTSKLMPFAPSLIFTSALFALGHFTTGSAGVVLYDLLFVFIDSVIYGLIFRRTDNAWCSFLAHFLANLLSSVLYFL